MGVLVGKYVTPAEEGLVEVGEEDGAAVAGNAVTGDAVTGF